MVRITKEEMQKLRERFPNIRATRTVHKYYIEEAPEYIAFLNKGRRPNRGKHA